ncbi:Cwh41p [Sugiyamaella lignohabitans]|uniref:Mannosyl-oligosaccharide glucosidase n=1 Tax=Sugiyamaella lignohabitans TaxID=796027 RepID=A0A167EUP7_9ASCO|nr:Cwh41p [Sugiyamaella lignohabitans]ANB14481.1 Cwh41p [Sugiyamaella lignohabitans]
MNCQSRRRPSPYNWSQFNHKLKMVHWPHFLSLANLIALSWLCVVFVSSSPQSVLKSAPLINEYARQSNSSLLWGPYRSNLYFGIRPRIPKSLLSGLMWYNADSYDGLKNLRHTCEQGDAMAGYGWQQYDPRSGGHQVINDLDNFVNISTDFVKTEVGSWAVRVKGVPQNEQRRTTVIFYSGLEGHGKLDLESQLTPEGIEGPVELVGSSPELGDFSIEVTTGPSTNRHPKTSHVVDKVRPSQNSHYASLMMPDDNVWLAKEVFQTFIEDNVSQFSALFDEADMIPPWSVFTLQNRDDLKGNVHMIQRTYQGSFEFDILYNPIEISESSKISSRKLGDLLELSLSEFDTKFKRAFQFQPPFDSSLKHELFAKEMFSNLVGGIGYFYGTSIVDRSLSDLDDDEGDWEVEAAALASGVGKEEGPFELFTAVPSRPFFPRGFYWDEGFHLIPVLDYDADLTLEVLKSWFSLVDGDGWIAREQILGPEARSKVPTEFRTQYPHYANPPTLMLLFSNIAKRAHEWSQSEHGTNFDGSLVLGNAHIEYPELLFSYAEKIYPELQSHYEWFRRTQKGEIRQWDREAFSSKEGYRWRGRTPNHCLTSGLDDYPRAAMPHPGELHVDLLSWIGMMTRSIKEIARVLGKDDDVEMYSEIEEAIVKNLYDLHWDHKEQMYCDSTIDDYEESVHVCHRGYVSLFPFMLQLIPEDSTEQLLAAINDIKDPGGLWSPYGIRSLSKSDEFFGTKENYWRGPIWINMNYMILESLRYYGTSETSSAEVKSLSSEIYKELRVNIVNNVFNRWEETGFAWEQYDSNTGKAQGVKHFLGWTSLVIKIMAMPEEL